MPLTAASPTCSRKWAAWWGSPLRTSRYVSSDDTALTDFMVSTAVLRPTTGSSPNGPYSRTSSASTPVRVSFSAPPLMQSTKASIVARWGANVVMMSPSCGRDLVGAPGSSGGREIVAVVQIGEQAWLRGFPAQDLAGNEAGR